MEKIASDHRLNVGSVSLGYDTFSISLGSFNKVTNELASIEMLRGDFVNNFSHEFKTPIVSIRGFAKFLRDGSLTD